MESMRQQYAEKIQAAYVECEHEHEGKKRVDWLQLNQRLTKLMKNAKVEGLATRDFMDLVKAELPDAWENLEPTWFKIAA